MSFYDVMLSFDSQTMLAVLFWSNLFLAALIFTFETTIMSTQDKGFINKAVIVRLVYSIAYGLFLLGEFLPVFVAINIGCSVLFISFYLDARLILSFVSNFGKLRQNILKAVLAIGVLAFNVNEIIFNHDTISRAVTSSIVILAIYGIPAVLLIEKRNNSRFQRVIGIFYALFLCSLVPRITIPMTNLGASQYENAVAQSGFYLVLLVITLCGAISIFLFIKERSDIILENMALQDQLTQIPNRHSFFNNANLLFLKSQREKREISLMYMDIDYFKKVNDTYGHDFGDAVLKRFAIVIKESARKYDLICRYGGEEFIVMVQSDGPNAAISVAERIMERLESESFDEHPDFRFTTSVGIATSIPGDDDTLDSYMKNADAALYEAKNNGRNRIQLYQEQ